MAVVLPPTCWISLKFVRISGYWPFSVNQSPVEQPIMSEPKLLKPNQPPNNATQTFANHQTTRFLCDSTCEPHFQIIILFSQHAMPGQPATGPTLANKTNGSYSTGINANID